MSRKFCILVIAAVPCASIAQDYSHCSTALSSTAKELNISTSSREFLSAIFSQECEENGSWKAKSSGFGLETVIKAIPVKLTGSASTNQQSMRNFCKTYAGETQESNQTYTYTERVVGKALDTFDQCIRFSAQGISVRPNILNLDSLAVDITTGVGKPVEIQGVTLSHNLSCSSLHPVTKELISYDKGTNVVVTDSTLSLACTRSPTIAADNNRIYDEATLIMPLKNYGTFTLLVPKDARLPVDLASTIAAQLSEISARIESSNEALNRRISGIKLNVSAARTLPKFACGGQAVAESNGLEFMYGSRDGTGCGVQNANWVKTIGLEIPQ
jgi:hypothetical protein